jgi:oxidoreductase, short chain dehydrogenase/reductase family
MGASSGIGYACAEALAKRGVKVGVAARHTKPLEELRRKYPDQVEYARIDVTKPAAVGQMEALIQKLGGMDIYFHVAGIGYENTSLDPEAEVDIFNTNTVGFVRCISAAYRYFRNNHIRGHIAAVTSVAGTNGLARLSAYSASKAAGQKWLVALEQLSNDSDAGITFSDIRPGWVRTPLLVPGNKYPMTMSLEYAVPRILKAIVRRQRVAVIDWRWNVVVGLWRMIPNVLWTHMDVPISKPDVDLLAKHE